MRKGIILQKIANDHFDVVIGEKYEYSVAVLDSGEFELSNRNTEDYPKRGVYARLDDLPVFIYEKREIGQAFKQNQDWRW